MRLNENEVHTQYLKMHVGIKTPVNVQYWVHQTYTKNKINANNFIKQ